MSDASDALAKGLVDIGGRIFDLEQDNKRLRGLIKAYGIVTTDTNFGPVVSCAYCGGGVAFDVNDGPKHYTHCPAFTKDGEVK